MAGDIQRMQRRLGDITGQGLPDMTPGDDSTDDIDGKTLWGTTSKDMSRNTTDITVTITIGGSGTRTAIEAGIMATGDTLASGAIVRIECLNAVWRAINADCDQIS